MHHREQIMISPITRSMIGTKPKKFVIVHVARWEKLYGDAWV